MKPNNNSKIWIFLTLSVLFLVLAYSPIGKSESELYVATSYTISNKSVNFNERIANAPKGTAYATEDEGSEMQDYTPTTNSNVNYTDNVSESGLQYSNAGTANYSRTDGLNQASGQNAPAILTGNLSNGSTQGKATAQNNDVSSLSSDLTLTSSISTDRQTARGPNKPINPGGKNPQNPAIPVGDGMWFLLIMAGAYLFWSKHQTTKVNDTAYK